MPPAIAAVHPIGGHRMRPVALDYSMCRGRPAKMRQRSLLVALLCAALVSISRCGAEASQDNARTGDVGEAHVGQNANEPVAGDNSDEAKARTGDKVLDKTSTGQSKSGEWEVSGNTFNTGFYSAQNREVIVSDSHDKGRSGVNSENREITHARSGYLIGNPAENKTRVDFESKLGSLMDLLMEKVTGSRLTLNALDRIDENCTQALLRWVVALRTMKPWALKMLDATGRPPSGLASGTIADLGQFNQCLKTIARDVSGLELFRGQYCSLFLKPTDLASMKRFAEKFAPDDPDEVTLDLQVFLESNQDVSHGLRIGVCVPSTCPSDDLSLLVNSVANDFGLTGSLRGCVVKDKPKLKTYEKVLMCSFSLLVSFVIVASALDVYLRKAGQKSSLAQSISAGATGFYIETFSAISNTERLLHVPGNEDMSTSQKKLAFFHGVRFISSCWIILGHGYLTIEPSATGELGRAMEFGRSWFWCLVGNAYPAVQTFLYMSGLLLAYNYLQFEQKKGTKLSLHHKIVILLLRRYIRVTAPLMFVLGCWLLVPLMFDGPLQAEHYGPFFETCQRNWWKVLLHINNLSDFFDMCLQHTWYVGVDWQIYMVICVIPILLAKRPRLALFISAALIGVTSTIVFLQAYVNSYQPVSLYTQPQISATMAMMKAIYYKPHAHVASYVVGVLMGYYLFVKEQLAGCGTTQTAMHKSAKVYRTTSIKKSVRYFGWVTSTGVALAVVFVPYKWFSGAPWDGLDSALYAGYSKFMWSVMLCWLTLVCANGYGGPVNAFLSWRPLVPLSRLTYGAYLIHSPLYLVRAGILRERFSIQHYHLVMEFFGCVTMAYLLAFLMYLVCEAPVARLEKLAFEGRRKPQRTRQPDGGSRVEGVRL
ncbi:nose resistant to fluoxetine protein 6-like isoform X4 [Varroa destructor]|uniref:Nose resistant-to-fluoxetine protein N-terminal domain-containing protein n=1 Tax=Varroa destructor TaxID=109461 RepID=A0A7M7JNB9_VARDE|nr:nose resistant to fluoxetine protein 6-like isoform X4 [Varroa destructor]